MSLYKGHGISSNQPSFPKGRLCPINLLEFFERVTKIVDRGEAVELIYLHFQRPLDKFLHKRQMKQLNSHGLTGKIFLLIRNQ